MSFWLFSTSQDRRKEEILSRGGVGVSGRGEDVEIWWRTVIIV
jgi:hypothetical protein